MREILIPMLIAGSGIGGGTRAETAMLTQDVLDMFKYAESKVIWNDRTQSVVGWVCTWEPEWCPGWKAYDFSQMEDYVPSKFFDMVVRKGAAASPSTGPAHDHTLKTQEGHYLLLEAKNKRFLSRTQMNTAPFDLSAFPEYCFGMWYLMYGRHTFSLNVYIHMPEMRNGKDIIFKASGQASDRNTQWRYFQQTIKRPKRWPDGKMTYFSLDAIRGLSYVSDIGIDDISIRPGACPETLPPHATRPPITRPTTTTTTRRSTVKTTRMTAVFHPMDDREWNPFIDFDISTCQIETNGKTIDEQYISNLHVCCGNAIKPRKGGSKCCDGMQYFPRKQSCCNDEILNKAEYKCCGGVKTRLEPNKLCCGGQTVPKSANQGCCNDETFFNTGTHGCCINKLFNRDTHYCCGGELIALDDTNSKCCGKGWKGTKYIAGRDNCCNGNVYAVSKFGCCGEKFVFQKSFELCNTTIPDDPIVKLRDSVRWKKPHTKLSEHLFVYRRKRSAMLESMSHQDVMELYKQYTEI